jgi:hypothetical protein
MGKEAFVNQIVSQISNQQSVADKVLCAVNGAAYLSAYSQVLKSTKYDTSDITPELDRFAQGDILLSRLAIANASEKAPEKLRSELISAAKSYEPKHFGSLTGEYKERSKKNLENLRNGSNLTNIVEDLSYVLFFDREGFVNNFETVFEPKISKDINGMETLMHDKYLRKITSDAYDFMASFDPDKSKELLSKDDYMHDKEHIYDSGIAELSIATGWS